MTKTPEFWIAALRFIQTAGQCGYGVLTLN
jgi:hypothetical protein